MRLSPGGMRALRPIASVLLLLILLGLAESWFLSVATSDPYGLAGARPLTTADVPNLEALYGMAWTNLGVLAWSPDGRHVAVGDGSVEIIDAQTGRITAQWSTPGETTALAWSPDGTRLAAGVDTAGWVYDGWVVVYDLRGVPQASWYAARQFLGGLAWSPQGDRIVAAGNSEYGMWTDTGTLLYHVTNASTTGVTASWSPDGARIAMGDLGGPLVIEASNGTPLTPAHNGGDWFSVAWSPDGSRIAGAGAGGSLALFRPDGTTIRSASGFGGGVMGAPISWSSDGTMLVTTAKDGLAVVSAGNLSTERTLLFPMAEFRAGVSPTPTYDTDVAWSPSGTMIAATGSTSHPSFRLWGVRHEPLGGPLLALGGVTALGLGLLFRRDVFWVARNPERVGMLWARTDPHLRTGSALFLFAVASSILLSLGGDALGRIYGLQTVPTFSWYEGTALLSAPTVLLAALVAAWAFHEIEWRADAPRPFLRRAVGVYGYVLLPFLIALGMGLALVGGVLFVVPTLSRALASPLVGGLLGGVLGLGFAYSGRIVGGFPWARPRLPWIALAASAFASIVVLVGVSLLLVLGLNAFHVHPPTEDIQTYGFSVLLSFGFVPLVSALIGLALTATAASVPFALRFASAGYARVQGSAVLELEARRKVLDLVAAQPGVHFRALLSSSGLGSGTLHYHLSVLEREGYLRHDRQGRIKRFFALLPDPHPPAEELLRSM